MSGTRQAYFRHGTAFVALFITAVLLPFSSVFGLNRALAAPGDGDGTKGSDDPSLQQTVDENENYVEGVKKVLDQGHVDIGPRLRDGEWVLQARDDSAAPPVWRNLDDIVFQVHDAAALPQPEDQNYAFTGANAGENIYAVPQVEVPGVVWLGWSTQDPPMTKAVDRGVTLRLLDVQGPGKFSLFVQPGNFAPPQLLWDGSNPEPRDIWVDLNTHTHANWVFTKPGTYLLAVEVAAEGPGGKKYSSVKTLRFAVGDGVNPEDAFNTKWEPGRGPAEAAVASESANDKSAGKDDAKSDAKDKNTGEADSAKPGTVSISTVATIAGVSVLVLAVLGVGAAWAARKQRKTAAQVWDEFDHDKQ